MEQAVQSAAKKPSKSSLRKINKILEPLKKRELTKLSKLKRSASYTLKPKVKSTIHNLYVDPTEIDFLKEMKSGLSS